MESACFCLRRISNAVLRDRAGWTAEAAGEQTACRDASYCGCYLRLTSAGVSMTRASAPRQPIRLSRSKTSIGGLLTGRAVARIYCRGKT
jgi:hypothetical protein